MVEIAISFHISLMPKFPCTGNDAPKTNTRVTSTELETVGNDSCSIPEEEEEGGFCRNYFRL